VDCEDDGAATTALDDCKLVILRLQLFSCNSLDEAGALDEILVNNDGNMMLF